MVEFTVTLVKAPDITEEECRRRIHQAYEILFAVSRREEAAFSGKLGRKTSEAAADADDSDQRQKHATPGGPGAQVGKVRQELENRGSHRVRTHSGELN